VGSNPSTGIVHKRFHPFQKGYIMLSSYPSIYSIHHKAAAELLNGEVVIQEKIDGSQISFGVENGELKIRSKGAEIFVDAPEAMFSKAVEVIKQLFHEDKLLDGVTYRGEYLRSPSHNTIKYDRIPANHIILFDIENGPQSFFSTGPLEYTAKWLGLECVPTLFKGTLLTLSEALQYMPEKSILGDVEPEGIVIKNYDKFGPDKKILIAKHVSEKFKEVHREVWKTTNPGKKDVIQTLIDMYTTEARWDKAVSHLRDNGTLVNAPQDIGPLMKEIPKDILKEETDEIKEMLFKWAWPQISRGVIKGVPEWYKQRLMDSALDK